MPLLANLILKAMISFVPLTYPSAWPSTEQPQVIQARFESIADDIATGAENSVKDPTTNVFDHDDKGAKIGLLLAIIAATESGGYAADVDTCRRGGDHNHSWGIFQLSDAWAPKYTVCHDRKRAVEYAINFIKQSFTACHNLSPNSKLSAYDTGRCISNESISVRRLGTAVYSPPVPPGITGMKVSGLEKSLNDFSVDIANL